MKSLQSRLLIILITLGLVPLGLSLLVNGYFTEETLLRSKHTEMRNFANEIKRQIDNNVHAIQLELKAVASTPAFTGRNTTKGQLQLELERIASTSRFCQRMSLLAPGGFVDACSDPDSTQDQDRRGDPVIQNGKPIVTAPMMDMSRSPRTISVQFYYPVFDDQGHAFRAVRGDISLTAISDILREAHFGQNGKFVLLDSLNNVLYHENDKNIYNSKFKTGVGMNFANLAEGGEIMMGGETLIYDTLIIPKAVVFPTSDWKLITTMNKSEAMELVRQARWTALGVATLFLTITAVVGFFLANSIAKPVEAASRAARAVAAGDMQTRLEDHGAQELKELALAFNQMTCQVVQHQEKLGLMVESRTRKYLESQEALAATTAQLHAANEATKEGLFVVNRAGEVITANGQMEEIFGLKSEQLRQRPLDEIRHDIGVRFRDADDFLLLWEEAMGNKAVTSETEWTLEAPNQKTLSIYTAPVLDSAGEMIARLWMFRDITTQRLLEDSLRQAQKMEAVGRLAGGVAHDFNNLLQGILGNLFLVQQDPDLRAHEDIRRCVHSARNAGLRAAELVKGLLGFSRQTHLSLSRCDVNDVLQTTESLVRPTFDPRITITTDLQEGIWGLNADSNQIEQVIMNMIVNARDAMPNGGSLMLTTRNIVIPPDRIDFIPGSVPGEFVRISVTDEGSGMTEEVREKIFEPFFTTKEQGKGTGLGLATSFGIVQQHGGWINCDSVAGHGTTFHIFLPRNEVEMAPSAPAMEAPRPVGGQETILVVDDELVVRAVAEAILKKHGYKIVTACDGEEALDKLARHDGEIDLVLMDMTMPRLSGMDTFHHMRKGQAPNVPVVICSGYLVDLNGFAEETGSVPNGFLQKPYDIDDMSRTVRRVLDETSSAKVR
jgi:two-component system cell cycle sensor histidine kinase/response regulator CckA